MLDAPVTSLPNHAGLAVYPPGATFGPRRMNDYEFVWLIEGDARYTWGDRELDTPEGSIVLCRPGAVDAFRWDEKRPTRHGYFHFNIERIPSSWPARSDWPLVRLPPEGDVLRPVFRHLLTWTPRGNALLRQLSIVHMLTAFVLGEISTNELPAGVLPDAVDRAIKYIRKSLDQKPDEVIRLNELAEAAFVTPEHLCRLFASSTGHSPVETVRLARLDRAAVLLARSNYGIAEIARMTGFASPFHFSRRFKDAFGRPPRDLRESIQSGQIPPLPLLLKVNG